MTEAEAAFIVARFRENNPTEPPEHYRATRAGGTRWRVEVRARNGAGTKRIDSVLEFLVLYCDQKFEQLAGQNQLLVQVLAQATQAGSSHGAAPHIFGLDGAPLA